jgi:hypothetical protein
MAGRKRSSPKDLLLGLYCSMSCAEPSRPQTERRTGERNRRLFSWQDSCWSARASQEAIA